MKKWIVMILVFSLLLALTACGGNVSNVEVTPWESEVYSEEDVQSAINEAVRYFKKHFDGCTLTEITYAGDDVSADHAEWAQRHDADEAIVLISSFDVGSSGGNGSLNPNSTYSRWMWIMVRSEGGSWKHADHGY